MRDNYVNMQDIYVNKQLIYVNMQVIYVNMQDIYVGMYFFMSTCKLSLLHVKHKKVACWHNYLAYSH